MYYVWGCVRRVLAPARHIMGHFKERAVTGYSAALVLTTMRKTTQRKRTKKLTTKTYFSS